MLPLLVSTLLRQATHVFLCDLVRAWMHVCVHACWHGSMQMWMHVRMHGLKSCVDVSRFGGPHV